MMGQELCSADVFTQTDLVRYQHRVLLEIHALTNPRSTTPLQDMQAIRIKAQAAIRAAEKSGLLA